MVDREKVISVFLMCLGLFMLAALALACSVGRHYTPIPPGSGLASDVQEQDSRAVTVTVRCQIVGSLFFSTGVLVGGDKVLGALHAFPCDGKFSIRLKTGRTFAVVKLSQDVRQDVALFQVLGIGADIPLVDLGPRPKPGDTVCFTAANPVRERKCGRVSKVVPGFGPGAMYFGAGGRGGNSGSGIYDMQGRLVGTLSMSCRTAPCAFSAGPLVENYKEILP